MKSAALIIKPFVLPDETELTRQHLAIEELTRQLYPNITIDYAYPIRWAVEMRRKGLRVSGRFVWGYPPDTICGFPLPLTRQAFVGLRRIAPESAHQFEDWLEAERSKVSG